VFDGDGIALRDALHELFRKPLKEPLTDDAFDAHARAAFAYQFERNPAYGAWCARRGVSPASLRHWSEIPAVPTAAFRELPLVAGRPEDAEAVFRTSGTSRGAERRGTHYVPDLSLYHGSLLPNFAARVLPDAAALPMLSLIPPPTELPDSSLAHMVARVMETFGAPGSGWFATSAHGIDTAGLRVALDALARDGRAVCILGTSFSFVHWLDDLAGRDERFALPPGSRLMDTGGYKGRSRDVPADALRVQYHERLGIPPAACINEYGMTELCSQFYDSTLTDPGGPRRKLAPPWVRTRVVDPDSLDEAPAGGRGLLQHFDLANLGSVMAVQTEDVGETSADGFLVHGRAAGSMPRGCSIAMDELLAAARDP
jgi:hypothetical protein